MTVLLIPPQEEAEDGPVVIGGLPQREPEIAPLETASRAFDEQKDQLARRTLDDLLENEPDNVTARLLSARLFERQTMYHRAFDELQRAAGSGSREGRVELERLTEQQLLKDAQRQLADQQYQEAMTTADECLTVLPDLSGAKLVCIEAHIGLGRLAEALRDTLALRDLGHSQVEISQLLGRLSELDPEIGHRLARESIEALLDAAQTPEALSGIQALQAAGRPEDETGPLMARLAKLDPELIEQLAQDQLGLSLERIAMRLQDDPQGALSALGPVLEQFPDELAAHRYQGRALELLGRDREAVAAYSKVLDGGVDDVKLVALCYELLLDTGDPDELLPWLDRLIEAGGDEAPRLRRKRAILHRTQGDLEAALADLQAVLTHEPDDPTLVEQVVGLKQELGDLEGALASLTALLGRPGADIDRGALLDHSAALKTELGDVAGALSSLIELVEHRGDDVDSALLERVVKLETETGDITGALEHLAQLIDATPEGDSCRFELMDRAAALKLEIGDTDGALEQLSRLLDILPDDGDEVTQLLDRTATIRLDRGDLDGALADLSNLLGRTPKEVPQHLELLNRTAKLRLRQGDKSGALTDLLQLLEEAPISDRNSLLDRTAEIRLDLGDREGALADLESRLGSTLETDDAYCDLLRRTGQLHHELQDAAAALASWSALLAQQPDDLELRLRVAGIRADQGDLAGASTEYSAALDVHPHEPNLLFNLGNCQMLSEKPDAAIQTYTKLLEISPDDRQALINRSACYRLVTPRQHGKARADLDRAMFST